MRMIYKSGYSYPGLIMILLVFSVVIFVSGCSEKHQNNEENIDLPENEIILIKRYVNYEEGYEDRGWFADSNGDVYTYDFSSYMWNYKTGKEADIHFLEGLRIIKENTEPIKKLRSSVVQKIYKEGMKIDANAEFDEKSICNDFGQDKQIFYHSDTGKMVIYSETGDNDKIMQDKHANRLKEYVDKLANDIEKDMNNIEENLTVLYAKDSIPFVNFHCGYVEEYAGYERSGEGRYVLFDVEQVNLLGKMTGIVNLWEIMENMSEDDISENYVYFVEFENVTSTGYDLKSFGFMKQNDKYGFIKDEDSVRPELDEITGDMMDGFCYIAAIPKNSYHEEVSGHEYKTFDGKLWKTLDNYIDEN